MDPPNPGVQLLNPGGGHFLWGEEIFYACSPGSFLCGPASQKCGFAHGQPRWSGFNPLCEGMGVGASRLEGDYSVQKCTLRCMRNVQKGQVPCSATGYLAVGYLEGACSGVGEIQMFINICSA